jgi:hypothetical protein
MFYKHIPVNKINDINTLTLTISIYYSLYIYNYHC